MGESRLKIKEEQTHLTTEEAALRALLAGAPELEVIVARVLDA